MSGSMLIDEEFVAVFPSLIQRLGSASRAIVLQTIWFARDRLTDETVMTIDEVASRTGLTKRSVERAVAFLRENDYVSRRRLSSHNATSVWVVNTGTLEAADVAESITPIGGSESATMAGSDTATLAGSSTKNVEEELLVDVPPTTTPGIDFETFWKAYPGKRKTAKAKARTIWSRLTPHQQDRTMVALHLARQTPDWTKEDGAWVPMPSSWLNRKPWEDDLPDTVTPSGGVTRSTPRLTDHALVERWDPAKPYDAAISHAQNYLAWAEAAGEAATHEGFTAYREHLTIGDL